MQASEGPTDLVLTGPLDVRTVAAVRAAIGELLDSTRGDVLLDVSMVDTVDVTGLAVLAAAHRRAEREGRRLVLRGCQGTLRRVLAKTKLARILRFEPGSVSV